MGGHDSAVRLISYGYSTVTAAHRLGRFVRLFLACIYGVGQHHFTDLAYADDSTIFMSDVTQAASTLQSFNTISASLGLRIS